MQGILSLNTPHLIGKLPDYTSGFLFCKSADYHLQPENLAHKFNALIGLFVDATNLHRKIIIKTSFSAGYPNEKID
jgi:hypothetical protein